MNQHKHAGAQLVLTLDDSPAGRDAARLAAVAVRGELRKLDRMAKLGLRLDKEQRAALAAIADQLQAAGVGQAVVDLTEAGAKRRIGFGGDR